MHRFGKRAEIQPDHRLFQPASGGRNELVREGRVVVAEDSQLADQQRYWGLLSALADGVNRWGDLEAVLGQKRGSLQHALAVAIDAGWVERLEDPLRSNRAMYALTEPIIRFQRLVIEPNQQRLAARRAADVWRDIRPIVAAQIQAPHLESLARDWLVRFASPETLGGALALTGSTTLPGDGRGDGAQLDLAATEATARGGSRVLLIGEVKATEARVGERELLRLDEAVRKLGDKVDPKRCKRFLVSKSGFTTDLERAAAQRSDVELVDLQRIYNGN